MNAEIKGQDEQPGGFNPNEMPFAAPCNKLTLGAPFRWLQLGWNDLKRAPCQSLCYGALMVMLADIVVGLTWWMGELGLFLGMLTGFVFIGPLLALTTYSISIHLERGERITLRQGMADAREQISGAMVFSGILMVVFLLWIRAATGLHIFFPEAANYGPKDLIMFLGIGSAVGAVFSAIVFSLGAFSLPMLMDRQTDSVTAVVTSANAVLSNKGPMLVWGAIIGFCVVLGVVTALLSWIVLLPLLGHAAWHSYRETIDASMWPQIDRRSQAE